MESVLKSAAQFIPVQPPLLLPGAVFAVELWRGFHLSFVATSGGRRREVFDGRAVARYYIRSGSFFQDALSTAIWLSQLSLLAARRSGVSMGAAAGAFQYIRIIRLVRFATVLRTLARLAVSGGGAGPLLPLPRIRPAVGHALHVLYAGLVVVNFFACLW